MKKFAILLASVAAATAAVPAIATAAPAPDYGFNQQGWQNINARQARLEARINQGIRTGAISRSEAVQLRTEFRNIARLEARYRASRPGLTMAERRDLDRRFDVLSAKIERAISNRDNRGRDHRGPHRR